MFKRICTTDPQDGYMLKYKLISNKRCRISKHFEGTGPEDTRTRNNEQIIEPDFAKQFKDDVYLAGK